MDGIKEISGRPLLKGEKRAHKIDVRFTEKEFRSILDMEKEFGITRTELVRRRVLHNADHILLNSKDLISHLDVLGAEMGRIGNNINQLARHANTMKLQGSLSQETAQKFNGLFEDYICIQRSLETALRKVIRMMGK
jgi:hypothetical protein